MYLHRVVSYNQNTAQKKNEEADDDERVTTNRQFRPGSDGPLKKKD